MSSCTDALLESFSKEHFTYINQIFGDQTIRQIISEVFPNKKYIPVNNNIAYIYSKTDINETISNLNEEGSSEITYSYILSP